MSAALWAGAGATLAALGAGAYAAAVADEILLRRIAGDPARGAVMLPLRRSALLLIQQRTSTERPDAQAWALAPALLGALGAVMLAITPIAPGLVAADVQAGIVLFGAAGALVMVAVYLQGWAANSSFPLIGGYRFVAQALSYEMPLVIVLIGAALPAQSLGVTDIIASQHHLWNLLRQPLGLPLFLTAGAGLAFWGPLSLPEAADLARGTSCELSGGALLTWRVARLSILVAVAAMGAAMFLGGWLGPFLPAPLWMVLKTGALLLGLVYLRHRVARIPIERFVILAWVGLIPLALLDVAAAGVQALAAR